MTAKSSTSPRSDAERDADRTVTVSPDGDGDIAYADYGRPDGAPVVFLHGTPGSRKLGSLFDSAADETGVRVLAPDRPGYGRSDPRPGRSVRDAGAFVGTVLDDADVQTAGLVAFSGGAPSALATAATRPNRVESVDIVSGATPPDVGGETPAVQRFLARLATTTPAVLRGLFYGQAWVADRLGPSVVVSQYTADAESIPNPEAEVIRADFVEAFARSRRGAVTEFRNAARDWGVRFEEVTTPVRFWHGDSDANVPIGGVRRLEKRLPNARLRVLDDADHLETLLRCIPDVMERHR
ncbi:Pimeloyl-ACP methyl ester carboxylesterase [Halopelagius inordinatus]|uniref:Pimeloyl-ACP methyl ester carboxylesterase n=1 Tax=Halopelagius inordinatus TaxID=553467 RepID=A0A1I2PG89_9EURY|nr:alpha/beta hydrolase [Halopelagius inordinatus]SFG14560.1 Pimeloyl-ACP methyl ester carboxylesterase [Halopelagius inordinatus]